MIISRWLLVWAIGGSAPATSPPTAEGSASSTSAPEWYVSKNGKYEGPVSAERVRRALDDGTISADTLVWRDGMRRWRPISRVPALADLHEGGEEAETRTPRDSGDRSAPEATAESGPPAFVADAIWRGIVNEHVALTTRDSQIHRGRLTGVFDGDATLIRNDGSVFVVPTADVVDVRVESESTRPVAPVEEAAPAVEAVPTMETAPAHDDEMPPLGRSQHHASERAQSEFDRKGFFAGAGLGIRACITGDLCDHFLGDDIPVKVGGAQQFFGGYRFLHWAAAGLSVELGEHGLETGSNSYADSGTAFSWQILADLWFHPVGRSRVDPYVILGLGVMQDRARVIDDVDGTTKFYLSRGLFRPGIGLDIYVHERVALGPRLDFSVPFAGRNCMDWNGAVDCAGVRAGDALFETSSLPKWLSFTTAVRGYF